MYVCINCGTECNELFRRYCPSVLKILKCVSKKKIPSPSRDAVDRSHDDPAWRIYAYIFQERCGLIADKYIEYDPVIVFVDLVLIEKPAYRHLLYNSNFKAYWKLGIILWLAESMRAWSSCGIAETGIPIGMGMDFAHGDTLQERCNFYYLLIHTALTFVAFVSTVTATTELRWLVSGERPFKYSVKDLCCALIVGGCGKLLGLLGIAWRHIASGPCYLLIQGYTVLCLLTAYSGKSSLKKKKREKKKKNQMNNCRLTIRRKTFTAFYCNFEINVLLL